MVAKVGSDEITVAQVAQRKENYLQMFGGRISIAQLGGYERFLDGMIRDRVVAQEAVRLGLGASDAELADKIRKQFVDASGQFVGYERYKERITSGYGDIETFEKDLRDEIAQEKLRAFVTAAVKVSDEEVQEDYKRKNTTFDVSNVIVSVRQTGGKNPTVRRRVEELLRSAQSRLQYCGNSKKDSLCFHRPGKGRREAANFRQGFANQF